MPITVMTPSNCTNEQINNFERLVLEGGKVNSNGLRGRIKLAQYLAFYEDKDIIVAGAALKRPNAEYRETVFVKSNSSENGKLYSFELGWVFVTDSYRGQGISSLLVIELVGRIKDGRMFATTEPDSRMAKTLIKSGFTISGEPYNSERDERKLQLLIK